MAKVRGGANLVERQPSFSSDGKLLLVCTSSFHVAIYSVSTSLLVNQLEGHTGPVTSINVVHYSGSARSLINQVWTSSLDGTIRFWNFSTGSCIRVFNIGKPIHSMVIPKCRSEPVAHSKQGVGLLLVEWTSDGTEDKLQNGDIKAKSRTFRVVLCTLNNGKLLPGWLAKVNTPQTLISSQNGGLVGMVDNTKIFTWRVSGKGIHGVKSFEETILHHTRSLQSLAFDPTETLVAGSDSLGRILIWKNVGENLYCLSAEHDRAIEGNNSSKSELDSNRGVHGCDDAAALSTYHWHSDRVNFLIFSMDGAYLFSGGKEGVFVMWQLESGKRQFLPRLGSSLLHCASSSDASIFSVSCADNSIKLVNIGTMTVQKSISGIKPPVSVPRYLENPSITKLIIQPGVGSLVLPAEDMSLQFYDAFHDQQIGEVRVSTRNYVSTGGKTEECQEKESRSGPPVYITHIVFSKDGSVMATAECHIGEEKIGEGSCLKFWDWKNAKTDYCLNTQIDYPHGGEIRCLVYHPFLNMAVSCSNAGDFKVWVQDETKNTKAGPSCWRCRSVGSYQQKPMHCAAFSTDGSILAVAAEEFITLWNPSTNGLVHVLMRSAMHPVQMLHFSPITKHLIVSSNGQHPELMVWNLETLSVCWSYHVNVQAIALDPCSSRFAIIGASGKKASVKKRNEPKNQGFLAVFDVNSPSPCALWDAEDVKGSMIFCFIPSDIDSEINLDMSEQSPKRSHLLFFNGKREYVMFDPLTEGDESEDAIKRNFNKHEKEGPSAFQAVFGKAMNALIKVDEGATRTLSLQHIPNKLLNCPSHLISLKKVGYSYIESLLEKRPEIVLKP